jgi:hypothetical protein
MPLELAPGYSLVEAFTLYNEVGYQTQGNAMGLRLGLGGSSSL